MMWKAWIRTSLIPVLLLGCWVGQPPLRAQTPAESGAFPPNPLESTTPDPLLPNPTRPLTPQEQQSLAKILDELDLQAEAQLQAGNGTQAFEIWNRELRLRRALGLQQEIRALGRVGAIAWRESQTTEVRVITERLQAIQKQLHDRPPAERQDQIALRNALGWSYEQVRDRFLALEVYQEILADALQRQDALTEELALTTIADLHLNWFDYKNAAETYQALLIVVRSRGELPPVKNPPVPPKTRNPEKPVERLSEIEVLKRLAYVYEQDKLPEDAIPVQQQLVNLYQRKKMPEPIPAVKLAIADNYQTLGQVELAIQNYQQAYTLAQPLQQYGFAGDALKRLAALHRAQNQFDLALRVYQFLLDVEQQSYDYYGRMNTFDQIAQIHLQRGDRAQALTAFQRGLEVARQLKYREDYFMTQIREITSPKSDNSQVR